MALTALSDMRNKVEARMLFKGNSVFSVWEGELYVVYSYGYHFPMYVWDGAIREWIGNTDKYSSTTSRHQGKCRPNNVRFEMTTSELRQLINHRGFVQYKTLREAA